MMKKSLLFMLFAALFMPLAVHAQQSLPYSCGFEEDEDLSGWLFYGVTSDQTGILYGEDYAHDGIRFFAFNYSEENAYLVSPKMNQNEPSIIGK